MTSDLHDKCALCERRPEHFLTRVEGRRSVEEAAFCHLHAHGYVKKCMFEPGFVKGRTQRVGESVAFDLALVVLNRDADWHGVYLQEAGGRRKLAITAGYCESIGMLWSLKGPHPWPSTYDAVAQIIGALDSRVELVLIGDVSLEKKWFYGSLRLRQSISVDMRPSDAFAIALATGAPILVSDAVLEKAKGTLTSNDWHLPWGIVG